MGVEVAIAVVSLAVTAAGAYEQSRQAKSAAKSRKEAGRVSQAEQAAAQTASRRQQIREERVRRAQITQSSVNTGVSGSSGELGSQSALGSLISGNLAATSRQTNASAGITSLQQNAADADLRGATAGAISGIGGSIFGLAAGAALSKEAPPKKPAPTAETPSIFDY